MFIRFAKNQIVRYMTIYDYILILYIYIYSTSRLLPIILIITANVLKIYEHQGRSCLCSMYLKRIHHHEIIDADLDRIK